VATLAIHVHQQLRLKAVKLECVSNQGSPRIEAIDTH